ncbi:hypothetical protein Emag_005683 [Eimeria magna]
MANTYTADHAATAAAAATAAPAAAAATAAAAAAAATAAVCRWVWTSHLSCCDVLRDTRAEMWGPAFCKPIASLFPYETASQTASFASPSFIILPQKPGVLVPWVYQTHHEENRASCPGEKDDGQGAPGAPQEPKGGPHESQGGPQGVSDGAPKAQETVYRYYRVFSKEELLKMCRKAKDLRLIEVYYDSNNWCVVLEKERLSPDI